MRIELPAARWAGSPKAQEDARTLTLPLLQTPVPAAPLPPEAELLTVRVAVGLDPAAPVTLTF